MMDPAFPQFEWACWLTKVPTDDTKGMKTAGSIPDEIFERAELFARRTKRSRSQVFSDAIDEYLNRHSDDEITESMNRVLEATGDRTDPFVSAASKRRLARIEW